MIMFIVERHYLRKHSGITYLQHGSLLIHVLSRCLVLRELLRAETKTAAIYRNRESKSRCWWYSCWRKAPQERNMAFAAVPRTSLVVIEAIPAQL